MPDGDARDSRVPQGRRLAARPSVRPPVIVAVLSDRGVAPAASDDALIADATKSALAALG